MPQELIVKNGEHGQRIDHYLAHHLNRSRSKITGMIRDQYIVCNTQPVKANYRVKANDVIFIADFEAKQHHLVPVAMDLDIVYEDDYLLVINKERGRVVHPGRGTQDDTLLHGLVHYFQSTGQSTVRPGLVHRIDKHTSGLLVIAKDDTSHAFLADQLLDKTLTRRYLALVVGTAKDCVINEPIAPLKGNTKKMTVDPLTGKTATTHVHVLETYESHSLVQCRLETGRTHQIRVHLSHIGHPIVGDPVYNPYETEAEGQYLCAFDIAFVHPMNRKPMTFKIPVPDYFKQKQALLQDVRR